VTPLKLASVVNNYDVMRLLMSHGGRLSATDAGVTLDDGGREGQLSRIAYMVGLLIFKHNILCKSCSGPLYRDDSSPDL